MPLHPLRGWTQAVAEQAPLWEMDCSCVVPMSALKRQPTRAFAFRKATLALRQDMEMPWPEVAVQTAPFQGELGFEPVDVEQVDLAHLIGQCEIDHSVGPIADSPGGVKAGYARNYLLLQGKALTASKENIASFEGRKAQLEANNLETKKEAEALASRLDGETFVVIRSASDGGNLYGSVTPRDVSQTANEAGYTVERKQVIIPMPIKELGLHLSLIHI